MKDIFNGFNYACEKISEDSVLKTAGYDSLKRMVTECVAFFEKKYGSIDSLGGFKYHLEEVEELYALLDSNLDGVDYCIKGQVEKHLFQNLFMHIKELKKMYDEECK